MYFHDICVYTCHVCVLGVWQLPATIHRDNSTLLKTAVRRKYPWKHCSIPRRKKRWKQGHTMTMSLIFRWVAVFAQKLSFHWLWYPQAVPYMSFWFSQWRNFTLHYLKSMYSLHECGKLDVSFPPKQQNPELQMQLHTTRKIKKCVCAC